MGMFFAKFNINFNLQLIFMLISNITVSKVTLPLLLRSNYGARVRGI